ncbi:MAG: polyprenyl synthetase family protein [Woeseiaceae bacterium]|nr:polyprenyl synthetase family protein [Woeseiaceae bacterium]
MFDERIREYTQRINDRLDDALPGDRQPPARLHEAMRYAVFNGGKRVRPLLVYAAGESLGVEAELLDAPAVAIELIHAFSLVHDDLPAMDDDDLRRGQPTVHRKFDEATAILAADALQPLAFAVLARADGIPAERRLRLIDILATACGSLGMTGGQSLDLDAEGKKLSPADIETMFALKTGALIEASVMSAATLSPDIDKDERLAIRTFAESLGLAFQIRDDILDVEGDTEVIGKPAGSDKKLDKSSYPSIVGLEASHQRCNELMSTGLAAIDRFGDSAEPLRWLAHFIVERRN